MACCHLSFESKWTDKGLTYVKVSNKHGTGTAVVNEIRFEINDRAAREAGLTVSSRLLRLAMLSD